MDNREVVGTVCLDFSAASDVINVWASQLESYGQSFFVSSHTKVLTLWLNCSSELGSFVDSTKMTFEKVEVCC